MRVCDDGSFPSYSTRCLRRRSRPSRSRHLTSGTGNTTRSADTPICPATNSRRLTFRPLPSSVAADAELPGVHVPRPGPGEGVQHEPHHAKTLAGNARAAAAERAESLLRRLNGSTSFPTAGDSGELSEQPLSQLPPLFLRQSDDVWHDPPLQPAGRVLIESHPCSLSRTHRSIPVTGTKIDHL